MNSSHKTALVVGIDSDIGRGLAEALRELGYVVSGTSRRAASSVAGLDVMSFDLENPTYEELKTKKFRLVYLCAAITTRMECETKPISTRKVNVETPVELAKALVANGSFIVFLSSSDVFSGKKRLCGPDDDPDPVSSYGKQKREAEERLRIAVGDRLAVVRLSKIYSPHARFVANWEREYRTRGHITVHVDQQHAFLDKCIAIDRLCYLGCTEQIGIHHLSGDNVISMKEVADSHFSRYFGRSPSCQLSSSTFAPIGCESHPKLPLLKTTTHPPSNWAEHV